MQDKIFRRNTQLGGTPKKKKNEKNRKRNVIMNFRVSPEEKQAIESRIRMSGLSKSHYFIMSCMYQHILVKGNIRTFDEIFATMKTIYNKLDINANVGSLSSDDIESIRIISEILEKIYGGKGNG